MIYNITAQLHIARALVAAGPRKELHPVTKTASRPDRENDVQKSFLDRVIYVSTHWVALKTGQQPLCHVIDVAH